MKRPLVPHLTDSALMLVPLAKGNGFATINQRHADTIGLHNWYLVKRKREKTSYAQTHVRTPEGRWGSMQLHRMIGIQLLGYDPAYDVDHEDRDGLNCVDDNLRQATIAQNQHNVGLQANNTSGFKGVCWDKVNSKWIVQVQAKGVRHRLGAFSDLGEAGAVAAAARIRLHGEFACT